LLRPAFKPVDYGAIARAAIELLNWFDANDRAVRSGKACRIPFDLKP
jgi:hypothetical protein